MNKRIFVSLILAIILLPNEGHSKSTDIRLKLSWTLNDQNAGEIYALNKGWYSDVGINLKIQPYRANDIDAYEAVKAGLADIGIYETFTLLSRAISENEDIVIFGLKEQLDPSGYLSLKEKKITDPAHFEKRTYGFYSDGDKRLLKLFATLHNINYDSIKLVKIKPNDLSSLTNGDIDFIIAHETNEPIVLKYLGYSTNFVPLAGPNGIHLGAAYFCKKSYYEKNKELLKRFIKTTSKGWKSVLINPEEAANVMIKVFPKKDYVLNSYKLTKDKISTALKLRGFYLTYKVGIECICCMSKTYWGIALNKLYDSKMIERKPDIDEFIKFDIADVIMDSHPDRN